MKKYLLSVLILFIISSLCQAQIPVLWGITQFGGAHGVGTIIKINGNGYGFDTVYSFNTATGDSSTGSLFQASGGLLYGLTVYGGKDDNGVIFSFNPSDNVYTDVYNFDYVHGGYPLGSLTQGLDGKLYGMTGGGGAYGGGVIFSFDPSGSNYSDIYDFSDTSFDVPFGSLLASNDGKLYGMTSTKNESHLYDSGNIFSFNPSSGTYKNLHIFSSLTGLGPYGDLMQLNNGLLYGMTNTGGKYDFGVIFSTDTSGNNYTDLHDFEGVATTDGANPYGNLIQAANGKLYGMTFGGGIPDSGTIFWYDPSANTYSDTVFYVFSWVPNGAGPLGSLLQGSDGLLYGMTNQGGIYENGVVFSIDTVGKNFNDLHFFNYSDGSMPVGNLIQIGTVSDIEQLAVNSAHLSIYPNPTGGEVTIVSTKNIDELKVFNLLGQLVYQSPSDLEATQFTFELKDEGMYFVTVSAGDEITMGKVMVNK